MASVFDRFLLTDRVALVTGAGRGIGAAIALAFADAGADLALSARSEDQLASVATLVEQRGRRAIVLPADIDDVSVYPSLVASVVERLGRLDVLVNNVGGSPPTPFMSTSTRMFEKAFHFNVTTAFALTKEATPHLLESGAGSVINISSAAGRFATRGSTAYGTAKAALTHLTRMLAMDLAPRVRVNAIAPGSIATAALETVLGGDIEARMIAATPLHRLGDPEDIAAAALWLASPAGGYVTGKVIDVDGGIQVSNLAHDLPDL
jgi:7-alpha-hydroxysteroid dehydrogenase